MDVYGFVVLLVALLLASALQVVVMFGAMYVLHSHFAHKIPPTPYGRFNFDQIDKSHLQELLVKLAAIFYPPTLILHLLEFLTIGIYIRLYPSLIFGILLILEVAATATGIAFILKIDKRRMMILSGVNAAFYVIVYFAIIFKYLRN